MSITDPLTQLGPIARHRRALPEPTERRAIRRDARITAPELAAAVGVSIASVFAWEAGRTEPRGANRDRYFRALQAMKGDA